MKPISNLISRIPKEGEAFDSIETITLMNRFNARVDCHLSNEFRLFIHTGRGNDKTVTLSAENRNDVICNESDFIPTLRRFIFEIDESMSEGSYRQTPLKRHVDFLPSPPPNMDIPIWDESTGTWYDAEY